jgi:hypothetical protein
LRNAPHLRRAGAACCDAARSGGLGSPNASGGRSTRQHSPRSGGVTPRPVSPACAPLSRTPAATACTNCPPAWYAAPARS